MTETTSTAADPRVAALAAEFDQLLRWHMTGEQYAAAVAANRTERDPYVCHTHDHIDANMTMEAAFEIVFGRPSDITDPQDLGAADMAVWNAAWQLWKTQSERNQ